MLFRSAGGVTMDLGTAHIETPIGGAGNDEFQNTGSTATNIDGAGGNDLIHSGAGADTLKGGSGNDTISYKASTLGVNVNLATGVVSGGYAAGDVISGFENVTGSANADVIIGDDAINILGGGDGNDVLTGGAGDDVIVGGKGIDTAVYAGNQEGYTIIRRDTGVTVQANTSAEGLDVLEAVEHVSFADEDISLSEYALDGIGRVLRNSFVEGVLGQGDGVQFSVSQDALHGELVVYDDGTYSYRPDAGYKGGDSFEYQMVDADGVVNIGTINFSVVTEALDESLPVQNNNKYASESSLTALDDGGYVLSRVDYRQQIMIGSSSNGALQGVVRVQKYNASHERIGEEHT